MRPGPDPSALYLRVPAAEPLLDAVRGLPGVSLLEPAHISLGYPWLDAEQALERLDDVRAVAAATAAWDVELHGPERFEVDVRGRQVVHLRPADDRPFTALADALGGRLGRPHLSVARVLAEAGLPGVEQVEAVLRPLLPLRTRIDHLEVTVRTGPSSWSTVLLVPLGGSAGAHQALDDGEPLPRPDQAGVGADRGPVGLVEPGVTVQGEPRRDV